MAGSAQIGALNVALDLNSAQFSAGLAKAQTGLAKFGKAASIGLLAVSTAALAVGTAMGYAVKGAIDHADALSKSAQKAGVTTEVLSRLAYAASYSGVSLEDLTGSLGKLSKSMADATANKTSTAATAFKALGISVVDANGKLRDSSVVFTEIADKFSRLEDGSTKTALVMQIFGKSGASLIPLLNTGGDEIRRMAAEADRLGITLSTKTGKSAERFNDTLNLIGWVLQGVVNKVMEAALPALQSLAQTLASPQFAAAAGQIAAWLITAFNSIIAVVTNTTNAITHLFDVLTGGAGAGAQRLEIAALEADIAAWQKYGEEATNAIGKARAANEVAAREQILASRNALSPGGWASGALSGTASTVKGGSTTDTVTVPSFDTSAAADSLKPLDLGISDINTSLAETVTLGGQVASTLADAFTNVASAVLTGADALGAIADELGNIGKQMLNQGLQSLFSALFGGIFGGTGGGGYTAGFGSYGSFDGGGYTGSGSRSGGLDGKGGFMAMLHPDETVLDHTKGQGMGGGVNISIDARGSTPESVTTLRAWAKLELPGLVRKINSDPYAVG